MIKVVLVEDEDIIREGMKLTVDWEKFGCQVIGEAQDGLQGVELIKQMQPDIVFTDIRMPKMTGLDMMEQLKGHCSASYIILSGYDDFAYAQKAINLGAQGYLLKPIDDEELEKVLSNAVKNHQRKEPLVHNPLQESFRDKTISKACQIMKERVQEEVTLKMVADALYISESYLGKLFKSKTGYTFLDILTLYRMKAAIDYLENTDMKVYEISYKVGYNDSKYFSKTFQKIVGVKPTEYRNGYHIAPNNVLNQLQ